MDLGEKIKILRESKHMTLEELGNKVGVGKSTVRKWENGMIANMRRDKIEKVARALDVSPADLMGWDTPESETPEAQPSDFSDLSSAEQDMLSDYRTLNDLGQQEATKRVHELTLIPSYVEDQFFGHPIENNDLIPIAAHHQPGITGTEEEAVEEVERLRGKYGKKD